MAIEQLSRSPITRSLHAVEEEMMLVQDVAQPTSAPTSYVAYGEWQKDDHAPEDTIFLGVVWENDYKVMMVGRRLTIGYTVTSNDSGVSWRVDTFSSNVFSDVAMYYDSSSTKTYFVASSITSSVLVSSDFGVSWNASTTNLGAAMNGVTVGSNGVAFAVGNVGYVYRLTTTDGFMTGEELRVGTTTLRDACTVNGVDVYVVGDSGTMYYSANSGTDWSSVTSPTSQSLYDIQAASASIMYVYGANNVVFKTTNGFSSTTTLTVFTANSTTITSLTPHALSVVNSALVFIGSFGGSIYVTKNGGKTWDFTGEPSRGQPITCLGAYQSNLALAGDYYGNGFFLHPAPTQSPT
eukprot:gene1023-739_t